MFDSKLHPVPHPHRARKFAGLRQRWKRAVRQGLRSIWLHRLRSLLTVLGIVFGVCSVIAMLAIGEGASYEAQEQIKSLGSQNIIIKSKKPPDEEKNVSGGGNRSYLLEYGLKYSDVKRIRATIPGVTVVVPGRIIREYAWSLRHRVDCEVMGTVPWYPEMRNHPVSRGRFFSDIDMETAENVCVLGAELVDKLFPLEPAIGNRVRVGSQYYRIVGIMAPRGRSSEEGDSTSAGASSGTLNRLYIPLSTSRQRFGEILQKVRQGTFERERVQLHEVTVKVAHIEDVEDVSLSIRGLLERTHTKEDFEVVVPLELLKRAERTKRIFNIVLGSIAAISLLVGGIGIMNIMLASVTERTREIGIRRALGAKRRDIVTQFLIETVILSGSGGMLGVALGIAIPWLITAFSDMVTIVTFWAPALAFSISGIVGVVFGLYPALRAADMDPVEALRHE